MINTGASRREDGYGISIDSNGAVWISGIHSGLRKYTMTSINAFGVPIFSASVQSSFPLSPITNLGRAIYEPETDSMFLSGYTSANPRDGTLWGEAGRELVRINNWSGSRTLAWRTVLPYDADPPAGDIVTVKSISMAGNRIIAAMGTTGAVIAYDKTTGQKVADLARGPEIGGYGGWLDTVQPVSAFQRSNGEYLIFVEEDLLAKIIMYRTGAITPTGLTAVVNAAGGIDLAWTDNCDRESGFELEQSIDGINFTTIATLDINTQQHTIDSPTPGQNLTFRIRATHSFDDSPYSNTATVEVEPPTQLWFYDDIGNVGLAGSANENQGVWTITSSGADIWGNSDQFGYLYQTIRGDFDLSARVSSISVTDQWAKAGVMVRESLAADAKHASMFITGSNGTEFLHRALTAGSSVSVVGQEDEAPVWVRLVRQGNLLSAYESLDGSTWNIAGSSTVVMNEMVYVGLSVTSHNNSLLNASTFDSLSVTQLWSFTDIGSVGLTGSATQNQGVWTVLGSGTDIWDNADQFGYLYQPVSGDFQMSARINSITVTDSWSKAGVMVRETLTTGSRHASMFLTGSNGAAFQYRSNTSSSSGHIAGGAASAPLWVRVVREGEELASYRSADGNTWTLVGSTTIAMGEDIYVGLAVTSHNNSLINTSVFEQLTIEPLDTQAPMMLSAPTINAQSTDTLSRSQVTSVTWEFSEPVFAAKHNLTLKNLDTGSIVDLSSRTFTVDGSRLTLLLDQKSMDQASGPQLFLANGNYELILSGVTDHVGNPLIATSNNTIGSTVALRFHKLVGDYNGDRKVNSTDYLNWRQHFGKSVSDSVNQSYDLDGDGKVTSADYLLWRQHLNLSLLDKGSGMFVY
ncbi:MAG: DUF1349 domain-containing protein [Phycisphaerales bacterium]|nr:DUF1349 domain-containing protein [Phycisphaerales bacterium]